MNFLGLGDVTGGFVSGLAWFASVLISSILGIVVAVETWFIAIVLNINDGIFQSTFVQTGFSVSLSIANLAFVLGIIVIAIATILRNESYGIKKLLWKLVMAAILVNFGLVIAAPIFGLGNSLTHYFLNCIDPAGGGCSASSSGFDSYGKFATSFAGTFQPQDNFTTVNSTVAAVGATTGSGSPINGAFSATGTIFGKTLVPIFGILATVVNLTLIIAILLAFILLLLIRYLYIAILAVLMPFAWASWVFPSFGSHWSKWWNEFIRWTFFSPIVLFFVYLAMLLMKPAASGGMDFTPYFGSSTTLNGAFAPLSSLLGSLFTPIIEASLREIIFGGLIVGGMITANSMGIKMAGTMTSTAQKYAGAAATWGKKRAWERTKGAVTKRFRTEDARNRAITQQQPGNGLVTRWRGRLATSAATLGGEKMIDAGKERFKGESAEQNRMNISTTRNPAERISRIERAIADKQIDPNKMTEQEISTYFGKDNEAMFKSYGDRGEKIYKEAREKSGLEMRDLIEEQQQLEKENTTLEKQGTGILGAGKVTAGISSTQDSPEMDAVVNKMTANKKKLQENQEKQSGLAKKMASGDPDTLTAAFQNTEQRGKALEKAQKSGKPMPASVTMDAGSLKKIQESIIRSMAEGFSPANTSALIGSLSKNNNLKEFEDAVVDMKNNNGQQFKGVKDGLLKNTATLRYFKNNPGKATIDYKKLFDIADAEENAALGTKTKKKKGNP